MVAVAAPHAASRGIALCFPSAFLKTMTCASPSEPAFPVPAADVRAQLARILDSPSFLKAPILSRFLRHVVEQTLAGATDALKEYSLGVDVFDRGDSFDPRTDTIVRVQARRLRFRLRDYYGAIGQSDSIRIEVPTGGYVALFQRRGDTTAGDSERGLRPVSRSGGRLPVPRTPLVGRTRELEEVTELVMDPDVRLLTLSGAGGSGKTRLALEAARAVTDEFAGGVLMLPLAPLVDPTSVVTAVGQMLGLRQTGGRAAADALREHVARSIAAPTLLVLDNFEHVLAAAPIVADLLDASAHVKLLVTSRAVLRVYGEHDYPVPPLALPHPAAALGQLECNPAVRLFIAARRGGTTRLRVDGAERSVRGRDLSSPRWLAAGNRACGRTGKGASGRRHPGTSAALTGFSDRRGTRTPGAPADASPHD